MKYFPFLRGKQNELLALRDVAADIVRNGNVIPILEPVNSNRTTFKSIGQFKEESMPFLFICNPIHGNFSDDAKKLDRDVISKELSDYDNWIPALYVDGESTLQELETFTEAYDEYEQTLIYYGMPQQSAVRSRIDNAGVDYHVFINNRVENDYIESIPVNNRVKIVDSFRRQVRNAEYPSREFFTDLNTAAGNRNDVAFGDFSIVGDYYVDKGGPAHAVALHHICFGEKSHSLYIRHFISDRTKTAVDTPGKIIEAVNHLVEALDDLQPNGTDACREYRTMSEDQESPSLGYMKRLAIKHHLEVILSDGGLGN